MSKRMSDALREEIEALGKVKPKDGEAAMTDVVNVIRTLEASGELQLIVPDDDEEETA